MSDFLQVWLIDTAGSPMSVDSAFQNSTSLRQKLFEVGWIYGCGTCGYVEPNVMGWLPTLVPADLESRPFFYTCSVAKSCPTLCNPVDCSTPGFLCPLLSPRVCSNSCPLSWWCSPTISSSVAPFSSCPQSFAGSGSFPVSLHLYVQSLSGDCV